MSPPLHKVRDRHRFRLWIVVSVLLIGLWTCGWAREGLASEKTLSSTPPSTPLNASRGIDLTRLRTIGLRHDANDAETYAARLLQKKMAQYYGIQLRIVKNTGNETRGDVLLGRHLATASGIIRNAELEAVKVDGYVVRGADNRAVIAGYQPQGTQYGAFAFLRKAGLSVYPWHFGDDVEVFHAVKDRIIPAFNMSETPFFELRDLFPGQEDGRFGTTLRRYSLGDLVFANQDPSYKPNGYVGWDHTAGYLVPLHLYYDEHPEYFAFKKGRRIPKSTRNLRVQLCMGNPEVHRIAADRALQWIARQPERRFFMISDGDSGSYCKAPESRKLDPLPDYYTDRALQWVNSVARKIKSTHPDKIVLTLAYMGTVKPPLEIRPESNVRVMYAPWYWDSRISSAVSLNHPLNITAFNEFSGWVTTAPNQIGVYDYPGRFVFGTAERIKLYADQGVRWIYFNGGEGELLHYVAARLLWNPSLETDALVKEFTKAFYGPAAPVMDDYLALRKQTIDKEALHNPVIFDDPVFVSRSRGFVSLLEDRAQHQSTDVQIRILEAASDILYTLLRATRPARPKLTSPNIEFHPELFLKDLNHYIGIQTRILSLCDTLPSCRKRLKWRKTDIYGDMWRLHLAEKSDIQKIGFQKNRDVDRLFETVLDGANRKMTVYRRLEQKFSDAPAPCARIDFAHPRESRFWTMDSSDGSVTPQLDPGSGINTTGTGGKGARIAAPMTRFPTVTRTNQRVHAGRVSAERVFDPPLFIAGCRFLDIHIYASKAISSSIYIDRGFQLRSDLELIAGEQVVRIDFGSFIDTRLHYPSWDNQIYRISFDFWPQDNLYPHDPTRDAEIIIFGVSGKRARRGHYPESGLRMTHFRTNRSYRKHFLNDIAEPYGQLMRTQDSLRPLGKRLLSTKMAEKYRTVTVHRIVSPINRIVTGKQDAAALGAAARLKSFLSAAFGATVPHRVSDSGSEPVTNAFFLRTNDHLDGFVVNAKDGVVLVEGGSEELILNGLSSYFQRNGVSFPNTADNRPYGKTHNGWLHEFILYGKSSQP